MHLSLFEITRNTFYPEVDGSDAYHDAFLSLTVTNGPRSKNENHSDEQLDGVLADRFTIGCFQR